MVLIVLGSANDEKYVEACASTLKKFQIPFKVTVASAHRSPDRVAKILKDNQDAKVAIGFAGHAAHLAGVMASHLAIPVIAVPLPTSDLDGLDSLLATVQMPSGVPAAVMAIGEAGSRNAAVFAAQILGVSDPGLSDKVRSFKAELAEKTAKSAQAVEDKWKA